MITSADYRLSVKSLAKELGCEVRQYDQNTPGMMYVEFGYVEGPTLDPGPKLQERYMVNLHELGHFALGHTQGRPPKNNERWYFENGVLRSEAEAWEWALDHSIIPDEDYYRDTQKYMWETCMGSYYRSSVWAGYEDPNQYLYNGNRHYVAFKWDEPDEYFWGIKKRLMED